MNDDGLLRDPDAPSFREKLVDFVSALVLVVLTILTAWNYSLPHGPELRAAAAGDQTHIQYPAFPGQAIAQDAGTDGLRRKAQPATTP